MDNSPDALGFTLIGACERGDINEVRDLILMGANLNRISSADYGDGRISSLWPLKAAIENGKLDCARELLRNGADIFLISDISFEDIFDLVFERDDEVLLHLIISESEGGRNITGDRREYLVSEAQRANASKCVGYLRNNDELDVKEPDCC